MLHGHEPLTTCDTALAGAVLRQRDVISRSCTGVIQFQTNGTMTSSSLAPSHSPGRLHGIYVAAERRIKPSTDDRAPAVFSVRSPSGLPERSSAHAAG